MTAPPWLEVRQGGAPLVLSLPHTGTDIPDPYADGLVSRWLARKDADWWIDRLYGFAADLDATIVRTAISRTVIDVNRDPTGASLYPGHATTELCPTTTFDGEPLYEADRAPDEAAVALRRDTFYAPYHAALGGELRRLRDRYSAVVLYDAHSIRSVISRLFPATLPVFNIGTNGGASCDPALTAAVERLCDATGLAWVTNGRFKGGAITRSFGTPASGVHAIQMELACRGYLREPPGSVAEDRWPPPYDPAFAAPMQETLRRVVEQAIGFALHA